MRAQRESAIRLEQVQDILDAGLEASGPARDILLRGVLVGLDELPNETSAVALLRAQALHGLGRHAQAAKLGTEIANWSRDHRGPGIQSDVRVLLSDIQRELGQLRRALGFADAALACAREDEDNHRIVKAHEARARALVALKRVPEARAALEDALAVVRPEGLRPVELRLLHEIAELPEGADRAVVADEALLLSKELMFPREEARALVNLARLGLDAGEPAAPIRKWLDRAAMWTEALGPTDRLDTIRDLRARLG